MSFSQLPDDVWLAVLAKLHPMERHHSLALVSRRCWQLLCSPQLLQNLEIFLGGADERQKMARLRSFVLFLGQRAAGHVRRLSLHTPSPAGQRQHEHGTLVAAAVAACRGLEELNLCTFPQLTLSSWLLPLASSLRRLTTWGGTSVEVRSLEFLTALERLDVGLESDGAEFMPDVRLPTSLTRLSVGNAGGKMRLPPQIGELRRLQHLYLQHPFVADASYAPLTRLCLTRLDLCGQCSVVPSCLSTLTTLQALTVDGSSAPDEEAEALMTAQLCGALPHLSQLTFLALNLDRDTPLQHLTALHSLHTLWWRSGGDVALPPGPWLASLVSLAAPLPLLASNLPLLSTASQLQQICAYGTVCVPEGWPQLRQLLRWAPRQPRLRRLLLGFKQLDAVAY